MRFGMLSTFVMKNKMFYQEEIAIFEASLVSFSFTLKLMELNYDRAIFVTNFSKSKTQLKHSLF